MFTMIDYFNIFFLRVMSFFKFIFWIKNICKNKKLSKSDKNIILIDLLPFYPTHINNFFFSFFLCNKHNAVVHSFFPNCINVIYKIYYYIKYLPHIIIYKSFGCTKFIFLTSFFLDKNIKNKSLEFLKKIKNNKDLLRFKIDKIKIGDLIYDDYLTHFKTPTLNIKSKEFKNYFLKSIFIYYFWKNYFNQHNVKAVVISHVVYFMAIPLRIALKKNIDAFSIGPTFAFRLTQKNYLKNFECFFLNKEFNKFKTLEKKQRIAESRTILVKKFLGVETIDKTINAPAKHQFSSYYSIKRILLNNKKPNVLIALHSFDDSPHCFGDFIFNDFYCWIDFLGKQTNELDYNWYLKIHPSQYQGNINTINYFIKKYPKFILLPKDIVHTQLIKEGIDCVLTVYGTIGFEYAYYNIPVINSSKCFPGVSFNFNIGPKNLQEYKNALRKIPSMKIKINKNEIYQYYFMRYLDNFILWKNFDVVWKKLKNFNLGKFSNHNDTLIYKFWFEQLDTDTIDFIINSINNFYLSNDLKMTRKHSAYKVGKQNLIYLGSNI